MNRQEKQYIFSKSAVDGAIAQLEGELLRLIKMPYASWKNQDRIRSLDKQIEYLESVLANFERDKKKL